MLEEIDPYIVGDRTVNVVGGFAGWFGQTGMAHVKTWKQAAIVFLAIFPTRSCSQRCGCGCSPTRHWIVGVIIGNVLGVIILSWLMMPFLTRIFTGWLRK